MSWDDSYDAWKTTPPEEPDPALVDELGYDIYPGDNYYDIGGWILSKAGLEDCGHFLNEEDETFECSCCEDEFHEYDYTEQYYIIDGEKYCQDCVKATEETAYKDDWT